MDAATESSYQVTPDQIAASRIIVVDDDTLVTSSLSSFFALELDVDPITFNDSPEAARFVADNEVDLIITDFLMPQMNGIQLLTAARRSQPAVPRVLLTGYADKENAIRAINDAGVFQYIEKPWDNERLKTTVIDALTRRKLATRLGDEIADGAEGELALLRRALTSVLA